MIRRLLRFLFARPSDPIGTREGITRLPPAAQIIEDSELSAKRVERRRWMEENGITQVRPVRKVIQDQPDYEENLPVG